MQRHVAARLLGATRHYELLERHLSPDEADRLATHHDLMRASRRVQQARDAALQCEHLTFDEFTSLAHPEGRL